MIIKFMDIFKRYPIGTIVPIGYLHEIYVAIDSYFFSQNSVAC